jgi:hypothetical protein
MAGWIEQWKLNSPGTSGNVMATLDPPRKRCEIPPTLRVVGDRMLDHVVVSAASSA